jgi:ribosomal protein L35AE/L33A
VPVPQGVKIELSIAWPVRLDGNSMLQLVMRGQIVRTHANDVAVRIGWHQFRTRANYGLKKALEMAH